MDWKYLFPAPIRKQLSLQTMSEDIVYFEPVDTHKREKTTGLTTFTDEQQVFNPAQAYVLTLGAGQSRQKVIRLLNKIAKDFGYDSLNDFPWHKLTYDNILAFRTTRMNDGLAPATINLQISILKMVSKQAWLKGMMPLETYTAIKECKSVRGSRVSKGRALNYRESNRLLTTAELNACPIGTRDAAVIALSIACGMRRAEIAGLKLQALNHETHVITILGKGNKERRVTASDEAWERLQEWLDLRGEGGCDNVFVSVKKGGHIMHFIPLTENGVYKLIRKNAMQANVTTFTPHDLRRTFATRLLDSGVDINIVRQAMGHSSIMTTQRYDKRDESEVEVSTKNIRI